MNNWQNDLTQSAQAFVSIVWPAMVDRRMVSPGELISLEQAQKTPLANLLDVYAGFDALQVYEGRLIRGIASRIQTLDRTPAKYQADFPYNTFTVRASRDSGVKTELEKRREAITSNAWLYPHLTVQAYLETFDGDWMSIAVIKTADLIHIIDNPISKNQCFERKVSKNGAAVFKVVPWAHIDPAIVKIAANDRRPCTQTFTNLQVEAISLQQSHTFTVSTMQQMHLF